MMQMVHELPGTTFSSTADRGSYDSGARAVLTLRELQRWLALAVACYHGEVHESLGRTPAAVWAEKAAGSGTPATVASETAFLVDFLPVIRRTLTRSGFVIDHVQYYCDALKPWIARREQLGRFILRRDPRDISRIWALDPDGDAYSRCRTGPCHGRPSAHGSRRPPSPGCASSAAPTSTRPLCSRWWSRCARSPMPQRPQRAGRGATGSDAARRRCGLGRQGRRRSRLSRTALRRRRGRSR
jgi:hypothetical protein